MCLAGDVGWDDDCKCSADLFAKFQCMSSFDCSASSLLLVSNPTSFEQSALSFVQVSHHLVPLESVTSRTDSVLTTSPSLVNLRP